MTCSSFNNTFIVLPFAGKSGDWNLSDMVLFIQVISFCENCEFWPVMGIDSKSIITKNEKRILWIKVLLGCSVDPFMLKKKMQFCTTNGQD